MCAFGTSLSHLATFLPKKKALIYTGFKNLSPFNWDASQ
jgi:hypothetical protein